MNRLAWSAAALVALTACSEGYQGDGEPLRLHYEMTQQEAVDAMSKLGRSDPNGGQGFALREHCMLTWRTGEQVHATPLLGAETLLTKQPESEQFRVALTDAASAEDAMGITLLADALWVEATQMQWLLNYLRRFC